jgi:putative phosphoribosyl transferase
MDPLQEIHVPRADRLLRAATSVLPPRLFADRVEAGAWLSDRLKMRECPFREPIVLGIPRGGVVLGAIVADALHADLDVILARKIGMPENPEFALAAVAEDGELYYNVPATALSPALRAFVDAERARQLQEIERRHQRFRGGRPAPALSDRSVIVVDDGIATGATMIASLHAVRLQRPFEVIAAAPVADPVRLRQVAAACDEAVCLIEAVDLVAVGQFYADFAQVEDHEVIGLLRRFAKEHAAVQR